MTDFYSQNRCVCSTRSHGPLLCAFCLSFHFNMPRLIINCNLGLSFLLSTQVVFWHDYFYFLLK